MAAGVACPPAGAAPTFSPTPTATSSPTVTVAPRDGCGDGALSDPEQCDDGNLFGGDGCAANCTSESTRIMAFDALRSDFRLQTRCARLAPDEPPGLGAIFTLKTGAAGPDGRIPVALPVAGISIAPIQTGRACTCLRPVALPERFGPGNAGAGWIDCPAGEPADFLMEQDHNTTDEDPACVAVNSETEDTACAEDAAAAPACNHTSPHQGVCNGPLAATASGSGPPGTGVFWVAISAYVISAPDVSPGCARHLGAAAYGADGLPCTDDDEDVERPARVLPFTTGVASARIADADNRAGLVIDAQSTCGVGCGIEDRCQVTATGGPFDCAALAGDPEGGTEGAALAVSLPILDALDIPNEDRRDIALAYLLNTSTGPTATRPPTQTPTITVTPTITMTPTITSTWSPTATPTATATVTPAPSATMTRTSPPTPSFTPPSTATPTQPATGGSPSATPAQAASATPTAAFSDTPTAAATLAPSPPPTVIPADADGNGTVTAADIQLLIAEVFDGDGDSVIRVPQRPPETRGGVDANRDLLVNAADLPAAVQLLANQS